MGKDKKDKIVHLKRPPAEEVIPDIYTNQVNLTMSVYDVIFKFGQMTGPKDSPDVKAIIRMSPQHAKVFGLLLNKHIMAYEKDIGKISLPSGLLKDLGLDKEG